MAVSNICRYGEFKMAAIDKIYGTKHQYDHFKDWCEENNQGAVNYFYPGNVGIDFNEQRAICNFPEGVDKWMLAYCPITFVTDQIKEQYSVKYYRRLNYE